MWWHMLVIITLGSGGRRIRSLGFSWQHSEFKANLSYIQLSLKKKTFLNKNKYVFGKKKTLFCSFHSLKFYNFVKFSVEVSLWGNMDDEKEALIFKILTHKWLSFHYYKISISLIFLPNLCSTLLSTISFLVSFCLPLSSFLPVSLCLHTHHCVLARLSAWPQVWTPRVAW